MHFFNDKNRTAAFKKPNLNFPLWCIIHQFEQSRCKETNSQTTISYSFICVYTHEHFILYEVGNNKISGFLHIIIIQHCLAHER